MIVPGQKAALKGYVEGLAAPSQAQPAGIDLTLREVHLFQGEGEIDFDNSKRRVSPTKKLEFEKGRVFLTNGCYKIIYNEYVKVPLGCAALGFPRSSLLRCGADVRCAVWDPGYHGRSESLLVVHNPSGIVLHQNAKVMQLVFFRLEEKAEKGYDGKYKGENR
ncbi:MAG: deoxyuridine 5'-triphosphate nucleotidohydrolase [Candidatus Micrarchaeota archaeon]|nr:deoxyuridine 5'-triphosphate nucleotidohydrolase [Candidatus Micrarchaeota archaeon]